MGRAVPEAKSAQAAADGSGRSGSIRLLVQPEDGAKAILEGLEKAKQSIDILIFRFDHRDVERALLKAAARGVRVRALIAYTNRGGEKHLRALEMRLLAAGALLWRAPRMI